MCWQNTALPIVCKERASFKHQAPRIQVWAWARLLLLQGRQLGSRQGAPCRAQLPQEPACWQHLPGCGLSPTTFEVISPCLSWAAPCPSPAASGPYEASPGRAGRRLSSPAAPPAPARGPATLSGPAPPAGPAGPPAPSAGSPVLPTPSLSSASPPGAAPAASSGWRTPGAASPGCAASPAPAVRSGGRSFGLGPSRSGPASGPRCRCLAAGQHPRKEGGRHDCSALSTLSSSRRCWIVSSSTAFTAQHCQWAAGGCCGGSFAGRGLNLPRQLPKFRGAPVCQAAANSYCCARRLNTSWLQGSWPHVDMKGEGDGETGVKRKSLLLPGGMQLGHMACRTGMRGQPTCKALSSLWRLVMLWRTCCKKTEALLLDPFGARAWVKHPPFPLWPPGEPEKLHGHPSTLLLFSLFTCNNCIIPWYTSWPQMYPLGHLSEEPGIKVLTGLAISPAHGHWTTQLWGGNVQKHCTDLMGSPGLSLWTISHSINRGTGMKPGSFALKFQGNNFQEGTKKKS